MSVLWFGVAALFPIMVGPLPAQQESLTLKLCNGGVLSIPLGNEDDQAPAPCETKGCHAGCSRKRN